MIVELSDLEKLPVVTVTGDKLGAVDIPIFNGKEGNILGFQMAKKGVVKKFAGIYFIDLIDITKTELVVEGPEDLKKNLREFDEAYKTFGPIVGVSAITESGKRLGRVADLYIDISSGSIVRFYLKNLLREQIVSYEHLVSITPKKIVFKDIVGEPIALDQSLQSAES